MRKRTFSTNRPTIPTPMDANDPGTKRVLETLKRISKAGDRIHTKIASLREKAELANEQGDKIEQIELLNRAIGFSHALIEIKREHTEIMLDVIHDRL